MNDVDSNNKMQWKVENGDNVCGGSGVRFVEEKAFVDKDSQANKTWIFFQTQIEKTVMNKIDRINKNLIFLFANKHLWNDETSKTMER